MDGDRMARLVPVVLAVILGLLGMHALVVADGDHPMRSTPQAVIAAPATTMPMSGESAASPTEHAPTPYAPATSSAQSISTSDVLVPAAPSGGHSYGHEMLHLCLAILAALLVLLVGLVLALVATWRDSADGWSVGRGRRDPPPRPPPTSVRLAQLCVMRN